MQTIIKIFYITGSIAIVFAVAILLLYKQADAIQNECCRQVNAQYISYECFCPSSLSILNGFDSCENLSCGSFCEFDNGTLIPINEINCSITLI